MREKRGNRLNENDHGRPRRSDAANVRVKPVARTSRSGLSAEGMRRKIRSSQSQKASAMKSIKPAIMTTSVWSFPIRGPWGDNRYRGNMAGGVVANLIELFKPQSFVDVTVGSGTSLDVCKDLYPHIRAHGLDLRHGFDSTSMSVREKIGEEVDLSFSHPAYHDAIHYSGNMWGEAHPADMSRCNSSEEFHQRLQALVSIQRDATREGGNYVVLIGDYRRGGTYICSAAELIARMPSSELKGVAIKIQHNCTSDRQSYRSFTMHRLAHEYVVMFERSKAIRSYLALLSTIARENSARITGTWRTIVRAAMAHLGGTATLQAIYDAVKNLAPERMAANSNWEPKVRQTLQMHAEFSSEERGVWRLAGATYAS